MDADMDTGEVSTGSIESLLEEEGEGEASDQVSLLTREAFFNHFYT